MIELIAAALVLIGTHYGISSTPLRFWLVRRIGEGPYLAGYSMVAFGAIIWLSATYVRAPYIEIWPTTAAGALVPLVVLPFALVLLVAGVSGPNPTSVGQAEALDHSDAVRGALRITRHPVMWAIGLWALAHLVANGDLASLVFFGAFATLALVGTLLLDAKHAARQGSIWPRFAGATSNLPLVAIMTGRQRLVIAEIGWARIGVAVLLYILLLALHPWLFGAPALIGR